MYHTENVNVREFILLSVRFSHLLEVIIRKNIQIYYMYIYELIRVELGGGGLDE